MEKFRVTSSVVITKDDYCGHNYANVWFSSNINGIDVDWCINIEYRFTDEGLFHQEGAMQTAFDNKDIETIKKAFAGKSSDELTKKFADELNKAVCDETRKSDGYCLVWGYPQREPKVEECVLFRDIFNKEVSDDVARSMAYYVDRMFR